MNLWLLLSLVWSSSAFAFPELSRHGYVNCTACHVSPGGGGLLTEYGRGISKDLLSTWAKEGEEQFAYGLLTPPERLIVAGYLRGLQLHREDASLREGRPILMQADIEAGYIADSGAVVASIGRQEVRDASGTRGRLFSRRHYAFYRIGDAHHLRAGRFQLFYGLNEPNHFLAVRRDLGFGQDTESYNAEYSFLGENLNAYLSGTFGNFEDPFSRNREKGLSVSASYFFAEKHKVGFSALQGGDDQSDRTLGGLWAIVSWFPRFFTMSQADYQWKSRPARSQRGYVTSHKLNYEVMQGLIPFLLFERSFLDSNLPSSQRTAYGLGVQFFPRPHFEVLGQWQRDQLDKVSQSVTDTAWLMLNFYL